MKLALIPVPGTLPNGMLFDRHQLPQLIDVAHMADEAGVDDVSVSDHVIMANKPEKFPYGAYPHRIEEQYPEPLTLLASMVAVTKRVRLVTGIVIAPLRPAVLLAKTAATLHALSSGRLVLGVSTSWQEDEYEALGVPFKERGARLNDTIGACKALWGNTPASFSSPSVNFQDMYCEPRPDRAEDIPIWFGGAATPRMVKRIVQWGDGWFPFVGLEKHPFEMMAESGARIKAAMQAAGRDPSRLEIAALVMPRGRDLATTLEQDVPRFAAAGVTVVRVQISSFIQSLTEAGPFVEELVRRFEDYRGLA